MPALERLNTFIQTRFRHSDTQTLNLLNSSLAAWLRYFGFLAVIRTRYEEINATYMAAMQRQHEAIQKETAEKNQPASRPVTPRELEEMQRTTRIGAQLHLEIESFYVFSNILLDRIASTFKFYFWRKPEWNHWQLTANLERICARKPLKVPSANLLRLPKELQKHIVDYRNVRIEHVEEPRLQFATTWGPEKKARIYPTVLYPAPGEAESQQTPTRDLDEILGLLDAYIVAMLDFLDANADKSILPPESSERAQERNSEGAKA